MKKLSVLGALIGCIVSMSALGQTFNGTTNTDWNTGSNWSTSPTVPSGTGTDVTIGSNVVVQSPNSDLIGNVSVNNNTGITINSGGTLTLGSLALFNASTKKSLTFSNSGSLTVAGTLYIYGDLIVTNSLTLSITGTMVIYGNLVMNNGGTLAVSGSGSLQVQGSVTGGNSTQISTSGSGTIAVTGSIALGGGSSSITGSSGSITAGGGCTCSGCTGSVCGGKVTPIKLSSFSAITGQESIVLNWATDSELNFDYFSLERSIDGMRFNEIAQIKGNGTTNERHNYSYEDNAPIIGRSYYRLTSNDFDSYQETFKVVFVEYRGEKKFLVSPNPSDGSSLRLNFNFENDADAQVTIYDNLGSAIGTYRVVGTGSINFDNALKGGVYLAKYTSVTFTKTERFLVK